VTTVVVIGGGFAGMAAAARLAKLGHRVRLFERTERLGGVVRTVEQDGYSWDIGPAAMTLPAAIRDLFRKSGHPIEKVVDLVPVETPRWHVFADGSALDLPIQSRAGQRAALEQNLGTSSADAWEGLLDQLGPTWELLRAHALEQPYQGLRTLGLKGARTLAPWRRLTDLKLPDDRLRALLEHHLVVTGTDPQTAPAYLAVHAYVERTFGLWTCPGGLGGALVDALAARLIGRKVEVRTSAPVASIASKNRAVTGVVLEDGEHVPAEIVVAADGTADLGTSGVRLSCVGLRGDLPDMPYETVVHGSPMLVIRAPQGRQAWTVLCYGEGDPIDLLAERGIDLRPFIATRLDLDAPPYGPPWSWSTLTPNRDSYTRGLYHVGGTARPGPGLPYVMLGAALVAEDIGKAAR
jgi:phytoene dehydrogenase-like protein